MVRETRTTAKDYDNQPDQRTAYLLGRVIGNALALGQAVDEAGIGGGMVLSGVGSVGGAIVLVHSAGVGAAAAFDLTQTLAELAKTGIVLSSTQGSSSQQPSTNQSTSSGSQSTSNSGQGSNQSSAAHHVATNKNKVSTARGGPWTPKFEPFFKKAGLDINKAPENLVNVIDHAGPHPEQYHKLVFDRLTLATKGLKPNTTAYKNAVTKTLQSIGTEAQTKGSLVNKLITK